MERKVTVGVGNDDVAVFTIKNPPVNTIHPTVAWELLEKLEEVHKRPNVKAVVLMGSGNIFCGGADIRSMAASQERRQELPNVCDVIEGGPQPVVAAISRYAFGGGLELALACHGRVAVPGSRLGLSELRFGLIPGLGGTQRLPRLVGVKKALSMMLNVELLNTQEAYEIGLVDAICDPGDLLETARTYALDMATSKLPFQRTLTRTDRLEPTNEIPNIIAESRLLAKSFHRHLEHPSLCVNAVEYGLLKGGAEGQLLERKLMLGTLRSPVAKALMHVFLAERSTYKIAGGKSLQQKPRRIVRVGVIGGILGAEIATSLILSGIHVHLKEVSSRQLQAAVDRIHANLRSRSLLSELDLRKVLQLCTASLSYDGFGNVDLVVEATLETPDAKKQLLQEVDKICSPQCILVSNATVATEGVSHPERTVCAEFFRPAHITRLVQLVPRMPMSKQTILDVLSLVKRLNKVPVVLKETDDGLGVSRAFLAYWTTASYLKDLGLHPDRIDNAAKDFGMAEGPLRFTDSIHAPLAGEANAEGSYNSVRVEQSRDLSRLRPMDQANCSSDEDIMEMLLFPAVSECCRLLDEAVVLRSSDLDIASIFGMGFPSFRGGIIYWACRTVRLAYILSKLSSWQLAYGPHFKPTASLHKLVACGTDNLVARL